MLYSELLKLTNNECTQEEYDAINAVYMTCDDMTKEEAASLWRRVYLKRHKAAAAAKLAKQHSIEYLRTLEAGHDEVIKGEGVLSVEHDARANYFERRHLFLSHGSIAMGFIKTYLGWVSDHCHKVADGNPGKLTYNGQLSK